MTKNIRDFGHAIIELKLTAPVSELADIVQGILNSPIEAVGAGSHTFQASWKLRKAEEKAA